MGRRANLLRPGLATAMSNLGANRLELRGELSELSRLAEWTNTLAPQVISADALFAVQLCLEEAVANIIMHDGTREDRLAIAIELERKGATLVRALRIPAANSIRPNSRPYRSRSRSRTRKSAIMAST